MNDSHSFPYEDIVSLPHPTSLKHPRMSRENRAAQFSPFAALTGHDAAVEETARLTHERIELDEQRKAALDERLRILREYIAAKPQVDITFFKPDLYKYGGEYISRSGRLFRIDAISGTLRFSDGFTVAIEDIYEIESEIFGSYY